jgi:hypothetical protein
VEISEGQGWRLVVDQERSPYGALIGGEGWACELTNLELCALREGVRRLIVQHSALAGSLMAEEALELELELPLEAAGGGEGGSLWLALSGDRRHWSLRLVLSPAPSARGIEGTWSVAASRAFAAALERLRPAEHDGGDQDC